MFARILKRFRRPEIRALSLRFAMDRGKDGHVVRIYKAVDGIEELVADVEPLFHYGYQEEYETASGDLVIHALSQQDQQTLLALKSMNPKMDGTDGMTFPFAPPILSYLRTKKNIEESEASKRLKVSSEPLRPAAKIDFDPQEGMTIETGYRTAESEPLIPENELVQTADGRHVLAGDTFVPFPKNLGERVQAWLKHARNHVPIQDIPAFLQRDLVFLKKEFTSVLTDLAGQIRIIEEPFKPVVRVNKDERGWLDFDVGYETGGVNLPHDLLTEMKDQPFIRVDGMTWVKNDPRAVDRTEQRLGELEAELTETGYRTPISQFASLDDFIRSIGGTAELGAAYQEFLDQLTGFAANDQYQLSKPAERRLGQVGITLRPYQRAGIHWLVWLYSNYLHGLLADDLGLGKTLQAIFLLRQAYDNSLTRQHSLILAPKSVLHHWVRELDRFYPEVRMYPYHGPDRRRDLLRAVEPIVFITTYATAANDIDALIKVPFFYIILDEATRIKNPQARRTQIVKALNGAHRVALSGIPVENRPAELWSIFDFLMRGHLGRYGTFQRLFENPITAGDQHARERLGKRIRPFTLRRLKADVAKDLPDKIELDEWCVLTEEQRQLYGGLQGEVKRLRDALRRGEQVNYTASILPVLTKLKQICDHPALVTEIPEPIYGRSEKFDWVVNKIDEILSNDDQVVVFSHFLGMLNLLEKSLRRKHISYMRIDGSTTNRQAQIDRFNEGHARVALCSILAAGYGVNLTAGNHVIHADRWWNPAVEDQASDRVHRIGQDKTVYVHRILVQGTLEERIDTLLMNKREMAGQIMGAAAEGKHAWTREELLELLRPLDSVASGPMLKRSRDAHMPAYRLSWDQPMSDSQESKTTVVTSQVRDEGVGPTVEPEPRQEASPELGSPTREPSSTQTVSYGNRLKRVLELGRERAASATRELVEYLGDDEENLRYLAGSLLVQHANADVVACIAEYLEKADSESLIRVWPEARRVLEIIIETSDDLAVRVAANELLHQW